MRVIVIKDSDAKELLQRLELEKFNSPTRHNVGKDPKQLASELHRWFHYHVVGWLQEQGANLS